jgi:hypothetical protein
LAIEKDGGSMTEIYGSHSITVEVWPNGDQKWRPEIYIRSVDEATSTFTTLPIKSISGTKAEAESAALELAKKWIDDGKPEQ